MHHHLEGQQHQYDLRERAQSLGFRRVVVIDEDLGRTGTGAVERPGFGWLLDAVCSGRVGAVLALEASRLARNNRGILRKFRELGSVRQVLLWYRDAGRSPRHHPASGSFGRR
jgi:DNA invertase Pin-like site-specific DNA recombinase